MGNREIQVRLVDERPQKPEAPKPGFFQQHFPAILTAVVAIFGAIFTYTFDTREKQRLTIEAQKVEYAKYQFERSIKVQEADLNVRRENLKNSQDLVVWTPMLLGSKPEDVEKAAISLASGGKTNTDFIISMLGSPRLTQMPAVMAGLRIADLRSHTETCNSLCAHVNQLGPKPASLHAVGNLSDALGQLRCNEAREALLEWQSHVRHDSVTAALAQLDAAAPASDPYSPCLRRKAR